MGILKANNIYMDMLGNISITSTEANTLNINIGQTTNENTMIISANNNSLGLTVQKSVCSFDVYAANTNFNKLFTLSYSQNNSANSKFKFAAIRFGAGSLNSGSEVGSLSLDITRNTSSGGLRTETISLTTMGLAPGSSGVNAKSLGWQFGWANVGLAMSGNITFDRANTGAGDVRISHNNISKGVDITGNTRVNSIVAIGTVYANSGIQVAGALNVDRVLTQNGVSILKTTTTVFTANGTWSRPAECKYIQVFVTSAGGGGGGAGGSSGNPAGGNGGGGGGTSIKLLDVSNWSNTTNVIVGLGGVGGTLGGGNGTDGQPSRFGTHCDATGGSGGAGMSGGTTLVFGGGGNSLLHINPRCFNYLLPGARFVLALVCSVLSVTGGAASAITACSTGGGASATIGSVGGGGTDGCVPSPSMGASNWVVCSVCTGKLFCCTVTVRPGALRVFGLVCSW